MVAAIYLDVKGYRSVQSDINVGYPNLITISAFLENMFLKLNDTFDGTFFYGLRHFSYKQQFQRNGGTALDSRFTSAVKESYSANVGVCIVVETNAQEKEIFNILRDMNLSKGFIDPTVELFFEEEDALKSLMPMYAFKFVKKENLTEQVIDKNENSLMITGYQFVSDEYEDYIIKHGFNKTRFAIPIYSVMETYPVKHTNLGELNKFQYISDNEKILVKGK